MVASGLHKGLLSHISDGILGILELAFYHYGRTIARVPALFILLCLALAALCGLGLTKFKEETRPFKLWTPEGSEFLKALEWQDENFRSDLRFNMAIYEAENVLDKKVLLEMLRIHNIVANTVTQNVNWTSVCGKMPSIPLAVFGRRKRDINVRQARQAEEDEEDDFDWSKLLPRETYCEFQDSLKMVCMENSVLEVFGYEEDSISSLTQEQILTDVNDVENSAVTGLSLNVSEFLSGVERDASGNIIKARAATHSWFTLVNTGINGTANFIDDQGTGNSVDGLTYDWEQMMLQHLLNDTERPSDIQFYIMGASSFGTVSGDSIRGDLQYLTLGFGVVFVFVVAMLGRCNMVESRPVLSFLGLSCVGLAIAVSYGLCSAFDVLYGPVNSILPFLLLGLGIDDMFVIVEAWRSLEAHEQLLELPERVGLTLGRAGVAITVTSLTDFLAFAVGSTTTLPALRSFCIYSAVGVASIYFFQATFFVAWLSLDQRRMEDNRHGVLWCWKLSNWTPNRWSQKDMCNSFFTNVYARVLLSKPVKIIVIIFTATVFGVSVWGMTELKQEFDEIWFLPQDSYLFTYFQKQREYYPSSGENGIIYFGNIDLSKEMPKLMKVKQQLLDTGYVAEVESWANEFTKYWGEEADPSQFQDQLSRFLFATKGAKFRSKNFRFSTELNCTQPAPPVTASSIDFQHRIIETSQEEVLAMDAVRSAVLALNFTGDVFIWARAYSGWETNKVIEVELWRNLGVALLVVALATLVLLASVKGAVMVVICVLLTLVDVSALMHWWGLTIDTVSCIDMVLAVGLCVDYAAHVAHTFITKSGTKQARAVATVSTIGPPVFSGGFSTFLAFVFLAGSSSHVFTTFFKIFFAVSVYGLYHGLVFLPVILSLCGPSSHTSVLSNLPNKVSEQPPSSGTSFQRPPDKSSQPRSPVSCNPFRRPPKTPTGQTPSNTPSKTPPAIQLSPSDPPAYPSSPSEKQAHQDDITNSTHLTTQNGIEKGGEVGEVGEVPEKQEGEAEVFTVEPKTKEDGEEWSVPYMGFLSLPNTPDEGRF